MAHKLQRTPRDRKRSLHKKFWHKFCRFIHLLRHILQRTRDNELSSYPRGNMKHKSRNTEGGTSYLSLSTNQNAHFLFIRETHENIIYYTRTLHYFAFFYILHIDQVSVWLLKLQIFKIDKFHLHFLSSIFHS